MQEVWAQIFLFIQACDFMSYATPSIPTHPLAHPSISDLSIKRRVSEPNFGFLHIWPSGKHGPVSLTLTAHKVVRRASMPATALHFPLCLQQCIGRGVPLPPEETSNKEISSPAENIGCFKRLKENPGMPVMTVASRALQKQTHHISQLRKSLHWKRQDSDPIKV